MARFTRTVLGALAAETGMGISYYNPGDGGRYRVHPDPEGDYFDGTGIFTGTVRECCAFMLGMRFGRTAGNASTKGGDGNA